jgi:hypothetical protein
LLAVLIFSFDVTVAGLKMVLEAKPCSLLHLRNSSVTGITMGMSNLKLIFHPNSDRRPHPAHLALFALHRQ